MLYGSRNVGKCLIAFYVGIHVDLVYQLTYQHHCPLYAHVIKMCLFSALSCSDTGSIIFLPFIVVESMIAISSLNDKYACSFFCSQVWSMASHGVHILAGCLGAPYRFLLFLFLLLSCSLVFTCMILLCCW